MVVSITESSERVTTAGHDGGPDEAALAVLDAGHAVRAIDNDLLSPENASVLRRAIARALATVSGLDVEKLVARQGWLQRLTGADIEARLTFELAARQVELALDALQPASDRARALLAAMDGECAALRQAQPRLAALIAFGEEVLARDDGGDPVLSDRFNRRLSNLIAIHAANEMAIAQFRLAATGLKSLLDRYTDIATVVVPLWRQHLFAVLHASGRLRGDDSGVRDFRLCHQALEEYFKGEMQS